MREAVIPRC